MRREVLTIVIITTIVITLVAAFGPSLTQISTTEPTRAKSIPIRAPEPKWQPSTEPTNPADPSQEKVQSRATVRVFPVDAITGAPLLDVMCVITSPFNKNTLIASGRSRGQLGPLVVDAPPGLARVYLTTYDRVEWQSDLLNIPASGTLDLGEAPMIPLLPVTLKLSDGLFWGSGTIAIRRIWPLREPHAPPLEELLLDIRRNVASARLQPGLYVGRVCTARDGPYAELYKGTQPPAYNYESTFRFDVAADTRELVVTLDQNAGTFETQVRVRNLKGEVPRPVWVWAESEDPLFGVQVVAAAKTGEHGRAVLTGLRPGTFTLYAGRDEYAWITEGAIMARLQLPSTDGAPVNMVVREFTWDGMETFQNKGRLEITVKKHGEPVEGARLLRESRPESERGRGGWVGPTSGPDGEIIFEDLWVGEYWYETNFPTCRHFRFDVLPGETTVGEIELCPEGTAVVRGTLDPAGHKIVWVFLHTNGTDPVHICVPVDVDSKFVVWDVPFGRHEFGVTFDDYADADFAFDVPTQSEVECEIAIVPQTVTALLPNEVEPGPIDLHVRLGKSGFIHHLHAEDATSPRTLGNVYPGTYRLELRTKTKTWESEEFTVRDAPVAVSEWALIAAPELPQPAPESVCIEVVIPDGIAPWIARLEGYVRSWTGDIEWSWETLDSAELGGAMTTHFRRKSDVLQVDVPGCKVVRVEKPDAGWPENLPVKLDAAPSRLIYLSLPGDGREYAEALWAATYRLDEDTWQRIAGEGRRTASPGTPESRRQARIKANVIGLVSRNGKPAVWVPSVPEEASSLTLHVPGCDDLTIDLYPESIGYKESTYALQPK